MHSISHNCHRYPRMSKWTPVIPRVRILKQLCLLVGRFQRQLKLASTHCRVQNDLELLTLPPCAQAWFYAILGTGTQQGSILPIEQHPQPLILAFDFKSTAKN